MNSKTLERRKDPERLFRIVDKVLKQVIGEPAALFIYKYLEEEHSLKREDIPNELEIFEKGLEKYLSISGASAVLGVIQSESPELRMKILRARNQMAIEIKRGRIGSFKNGNRN